MTALIGNYEGVLSGGLRFTLETVNTIPRTMQELEGLAREYRKSIEDGCTPYTYFKVYGVRKKDGTWLEEDLADKAAWLIAIRLVYWKESVRGMKITLRSTLNTSIGFDPDVEPFELGW